MPRHFLLFLLVAMAATLSTGCRESPVEVRTETIREVVRYESQPSASVSGRIRVPIGVSAAGVTVFAEGTSFMAFTDSGGYYELGNLPEGTFLLRAMRPDLGSAEVGEVQVELEDIDDPQPFLDLGVTEMRSDPASLYSAAQAADLGRIRGTVVLRGPSDTGEVIVELVGAGFRTVSDDDGRFEIMNVPEGEYTVRFRKRDFASEEQSVRVEPGRAAEMEEVVLTATAPTTARPRGRAIFGRITMVGIEGQRVRDFNRATVVLEGTSYTMTPSDTGAYEFSNLDPGTYVVSARAENYLLEQRFQVDLTEVQATEVNLTLLADPDAVLREGTVAGQVLLEDKPSGEYGGVNVSLDGTNLFATTDAEGYYIIDHVPPGSYSLTATLNGFRTGRRSGIEVEPDEAVVIEPITLEIEGERPQVVATNPSSGARDVSIEDPTVVVIQFNQRMDQDSLRNAITISPEVSHRVATRGQHPRAGDDRVVLLLDGYTRSGQPLRYTTRYTVTVSGSVENAEGLAMRDDHSFSFTTGAAKIVGTSPPDGTRDVFVNLSNPIRVHFNAKIDPESVGGADDIVIRPAPTTNPQVYLVDDPRTGWSSLVIGTLLDPETEYRITVRGRYRTLTRSRVTNTPYTFTITTTRRWEGRVTEDDRTRRDRVEEERRRSR